MSMNHVLRIHFDPPQQGWLPVSLTTTEQQLTFTASHVPYSSLSTLVDGLISLLLTPHPALIIRWNTEPIEYVFFLTADDTGAQLNIQHMLPHQPHEDMAQVFRYHAPVTSFWGGLRNLEG